MTGEARPTRPASLSLRLVAGALVWLAVLLAVGGGVLTLAFRDTVEQQFGHRLDAMLRALIAAAETGPEGRVALLRPLGDPRFEQIFSGWYWQISTPDGRIERSRSLWDAALPTHPGGREAEIRHLEGPKGEPLLAIERDLEFPGVSGPVHLLVAGNLDEVQGDVRRFDALLAVSLGLLGAGMALAVLIQVRFGLGPLRAMRADLDAVRSGERPRLEGRYPEEVAPLAQAMNAVLDEDAHMIERARTHVGNLAHGLKTPLAVVSAEMAGTPDRQVVSEQIRAMRRLIEHHLGRASSVAGAGRTLGPRIAVGEVAAGIASALRRIFAGRHLSIEMDIPERAAFRGHREDLEEILGNLMENACKWAATRVRVSAEGEEGALTLTIEDDGPGLTEQQAREASGRGARLDEMAPGWGLGLAIVSDLVALDGGEMSFARSGMGGLKVTLRLGNRPPLGLPPASP